MEVGSRATGTDPSCVLSVCDDKGARFHFKTHDRRVAARWIFKILLAAAPREGTGGGDVTCDAARTGESGGATLGDAVTKTRLRAKSGWN